MTRRLLKNVQIQKEFESFDSVLEREGNILVSKKRPTALLVQTPSMILKTEIKDEDFVYFKAKSHIIEFFAEVEEAVVAAAIKNASIWFKEDISKDQIRSSLKSFVDKGQRTIKLRVADCVTAFDASKKKISLSAVGVGTRLKLLVELGRITLSKTQFGAVWNLKQLRLTDSDSCLFEDDCHTGLVESLSNDDSICIAEEEEEEEQKDHDDEEKLLENLE
jgi:Family of unknown function (DUF5871)